MPRVALATGSKVITIDPVGDPRWDSFVRSHPSATVYHLAEWARILEESYRYKPRYLALEDSSGQLNAVMPLMSRRTLRGRVLRSLPVYAIGGPIGQDRQCQAQLMAAALAIAEGEGASAHVGSFTGGLEEEVPGWIAVESPPSWVLSVPSDMDGLERWAKLRSRTLVKQIRQAAKAGVRVRESDSDEDLKRFYGMHLANMRRKHFVTRTFRQIQLTKHLFSERGAFRLWIAEHEGRPIAGRVSLVLGGMVENLHIAYAEGSLSLHPHHALNHHLMIWAVEHGMSRLSFGYSWPESGVGAFKARWGAEPVPLFGYAWRPGGVPESTRTPDPRLRAGDSPAGGKNRLMGWVWERTPLPLLGIATTIARRYL